MKSNTIFKWISLSSLAFLSSAFIIQSHAATSVGIEPGAKPNPAPATTTGTTPTITTTAVTPTKGAASGAQPIGLVVWVKGAVKAALPNQQPRSLSRRSPIYVQDTIMTATAGTGEVVFTDNSIVSLSADTTFKIDEYKFGKDVPPGKSKYVASLVKGGFRTITGLIPKDNSDNYAVNTPVATIGIRTTDYRASYVNGQLYVGFKHGTPCVSNKKGTLCLSDTTPYASVSGGGAPQGTTQKPDAFQQDISIVPASITTGGPGTGGSQTVSGFCLQ